MSRVLERLKYSADDDHDLVVIRVGTLSGSVIYQQAFRIDQALRVGAKACARHHKAPATFWHALDLKSLDDCPRAHRQPRRSSLVPTVGTWEVRVNGAEVELYFDDPLNGVGIDFEDAVFVGHTIRRAGRRAKAWAGDQSRVKQLLGNLTSAEEDDRIGV